jgi:FkbM family methyltransferase
MNRADWVSWAGKLPVVSTALRRCADRFPEGSVVRIRTGAAAGYRWQRHHRYVNGYWIGHHEPRMQEALRRWLKPGDTFFDVGASAGFFTLVAARLVGPSGRCVAFDPAPENYQSITAQIQLNHLVNCQAAQVAIGNGDCRQAFWLSAPGSSTAHLGEPRHGEHETEVNVITLDRAAHEFGSPDWIKMDIEGGEVAAVGGAKRLLCDVRPGLLIELHGAECARAVKGILAAAGYDFFDLRGRPVCRSDDLPHHVLARSRS